MAKKAYIGVDNVARRIRKGYIGVDGVARRIRKVYIGIGGVARPCWGGELEYYGTAPNSLGISKQCAQGASNSKYAVIAFGMHERAPVYDSSVDAFDKSLTRYNPEYGSAVYAHRGTCVGDYAIFAGGVASGSSTIANAYDSSLTKKTASIDYERRNPGFETCGNGHYAVLAGGYYYVGTYNYQYYWGYAEAFDESLTKHDCPSLAVGRDHIATAHIGNYALFAGAMVIINGRTVVVDVYDEQLTHITVEDLSSVVLNDLGASTNNHAIFNVSSGWDAYDKSLTKTSFENTAVISSTIGGDGSSTSLEEFALFHFGRAEYIVYFDDSLTQKRMYFGTSRSNEASASIGDFALFAGGNIYATEDSGALDSGALTNSIEIFTIT